MTPATILTTRPGYVPATVVADFLPELIDTYGPGFIAHWCGGLSTDTVNAIRRGERKELATDVAGPIWRMWEAHQQHQIPVGQIPRQRVPHTGAIVCPIGPELLRAMYALTTTYGPTLTAQLCEVSTVTLRKLLEGITPTCRIITAHNILDAHQAHVDGRIEITTQEVAA